MNRVIFFYLTERAACMVLRLLLSVLITAVLRTFGRSQLLAKKFVATGELLYFLLVA